MSPYRQRLPFSFLALALGLLLVDGCLGDDFRNLPLSLTELDHGWLVSIEPEEQLEVFLSGSAAYPDAPWRVTEFDSAVITLEAEEHETPRPPSGDPEGMEPDDYDPGALVSSGLFVFTGRGLGETVLKFELVVDGRPIDIAEYMIAVVADACEAETAAVANRCGGDGFQYHPQAESEWGHGGQIVSDPGAEIELVLTGNALHPDEPWQVVDYDPETIAVEGGVVRAGRNSGDFSEVDPFVSHSFLPSQTFTIRSVGMGQSPLALEIAVDGKRIDLHDLTIDVVEDAEAVGEGGGGQMSTARTVASESGRYTDVGARSPTG